MACCKEQSVYSPSFDQGNQDSIDYSGQQQGGFLASNKLCFKCATFWIIIVALAFFVLAGSRR